MVIKYHKNGIQNLYFYQFLFVVLSYLNERGIYLLPNKHQYDYINRRLKRLKLAEVLISCFLFFEVYPLTVLILSIFKKPNNDTNKLEINKML